MDNVSDRESPLRAASPLAPEQLHFTGNGAEYFGVWIVNLLLTIITLGIYSAWAKVRRKQNFYRQTEVAGAPFDFFAQPPMTLNGRGVWLVIPLASDYSVSFVLSVAILLSGA